MGKGGPMLDKSEKPDREFQAHELITTKQLAHYLHVSVNVIERWRGRQKGPEPTYVGSRVRYIWANVLHWLKTGGR